MNEKRATKGFILALLAISMVVTEFFIPPYDSMMAIIMLAMGWGFALASLVYFLKIEEDKRGKELEA